MGVKRWVIINDQLGLFDENLQIVQFLGSNTSVPIGEASNNGQIAVKMAKWHEFFFNKTGFGQNDYWLAITIVIGSLLFSIFTFWWIGIIPIVALIWGTYMNYTRKWI